MKTRIEALVSLLTDCLLSFAASAQTQKVGHVGVLLWSNTTAGQVAMRKGLEDEVERDNQTARKSASPTSFQKPWPAQHAMRQNTATGPL